MASDDVERMDADQTWITVRTRCINGVFNRVLIPVRSGEQSQVKEPCDCGGFHETALSLLDLDRLIQRAREAREETVMKSAVEGALSASAARSKRDMPGHYVQVEWHPDYHGGDFDGWNSNYDYMELADGLSEENIEERFERQTGASRENIIHYTFDELYVKDDDGEFVSEDDIDDAGEDE